MSHSIFPSCKGNWGADCNSGTHSATTVDLTWKCVSVFMVQKMSQQKHPELKDLKAQQGTANWDWGRSQIHSRITLGDAFAETLKGVFDIF